MNVAEALVARGEEMAEKTKAMKEWAVENYDKGADTMVECWDDSNYHDVLVQEDFNLVKAIGFLEQLASIYSDRQADANYYSRGEQD